MSYRSVFGEVVRGRRFEFRCLDYHEPNFPKVFEPAFDCRNRCPGELRDVRVRRPEYLRLGVAGNLGQRVVYSECGHHGSRSIAVQSFTDKTSCRLRLPAKRPVARSTGMSLIAHGGSAGARTCRSVQGDPSAEATARAGGSCDSPSSARSWHRSRRSPPVAERHGRQGRPRRRPTGRHRRSSLSLHDIAARECVGLINWNPKAPPPEPNDRKTTGCNPIVDLPDRNRIALSECLACN